MWLSGFEVLNFYLLLVERIFYGYHNFCLTFKYLRLKTSLNNKNYGIYRVRIIVINVCMCLININRITKKTICKQVDYRFSFYKFAVEKTS